MKRNFCLVGIIGIALAIGMTLIGCASTQDLGMYDPSIPETEQCVLEITGGLHINTFDGKKVGPDGFLGEKALAGWGLDGYAANMAGNKGTATIKIPAGRHDLIVGFYIGNAEGHTKQSNLTISHDFAAGRWKSRTPISALTGRQRGGRPPEYTEFHGDKDRICNKNSVFLRALRGYLLPAPPPRAALDATRLRNRPQPATRRHSWPQRYALTQQSADPAQQSSTPPFSLLTLH